MEKYNWKITSQIYEPTVQRILWDTREECPAGSQVGPEVRSLYLIECNVSGYGSVIINGKKFDVGPRCCYVMHAGDEITLKADEIDPKIALWCSFGGKRVGEILRAAGITAEQPFASAEKFDELLSVLERLYAISRKNDLGSELRKTSLLYEFLAILSKDKADMGCDLICDRAVTIMEGEYSKNISVSDIAAELGFDRSYFSTLFREHTGSTPYAYLTSIRMRRACDLLTDPSLSVSDIAEKVGIDPHNFSRIFKRKVGMSPAEYKKAKHIE